MTGLIQFMVSGKQNDVAECMDNCMFQIEAAMQFDSDKSTFGEPSAGLGLVKRYSNLVSRGIHMTLMSAIFLLKDCSMERNGNELPPYRTTRLSHQSV